MILVLLEAIPSLHLVDEGTPRHVIRPPHPVHVAMATTLVLAHRLELLPLGAGAAQHVHLIPALLRTTYVHIPSFTPTIAAPNSSHAYSYHNPANKPC